jgi:hypothetical protein
MPQADTPPVISASAGPLQDQDEKGSMIVDGRIPLSSRLSRNRDGTRAPVRPVLGAVRGATQAPRLKLERSAERTTLSHVAWSARLIRVDGDGLIGPDLNRPMAKGPADLQGGLALDVPVLIAHHSCRRNASIHGTVAALGPGSIPGMLYQHVTSYPYRRRK